ncbi:MAG: Two-component system, chemotaxis family, CheB/CheR fusion protein [Mucilaginibacter sp.]|nr:Two-component system, chemotaxis family, CheB/CheR fusion protein [Mucilaginibacter sp.]
MKPSMRFDFVIAFIRNKIWNQEHIRQRPFWLKLFIPIILSLIITWLITQRQALSGEHIQYLLYFAVVMISATYGGSLSALFATLSSTVNCLLLLNNTDFFKSSIIIFLCEGLLLTGLFWLIELMYDRLKISEEKFRGIIEKSSEGFLLGNAEGEILYVCPSSQDILGYTVEELIGVNLHSLIHPDELKTFKINFLKLLQNDGQSIIFFQRVKTKDNDWKWIEGCVNNLLKDERVRAIVFQYRNVTARINQDKQREDFVHMASHELKSPITALKGFLQLIQLNNNKEVKDKDLHLISRMDIQLNRLLGVIDDMLDITRIKAGELRYHFQWFNFAECVVEVIEALQATTTSHYLNITEVKNAEIYGDRDKIGQVINNLVTNAVKYSPGTKIINITMVKEMEFVSLKVKDYGIGIAKDKQRKIFERFYRVDTLPKDTFHGLGLGLYIAMEIIKKHKGKMGVDSEEGKGSEFWFSLPLNILPDDGWGLISQAGNRKILQK